MTFASFEAATEALNIYFLSASPVSSFSSGTALSAAVSLEGFQVFASSSLIGLRLLSPSSTNVLLTPDWPLDFFSFARTANQTGTFTATGNVTSSLALNTAQPTATLVVAYTSAVPEPATASLLGLWLFGIAGWQMIRRSK